jgi:xanthine dehydrogenase accessory factor
MPNHQELTGVLTKQIKRVLNNGSTAVMATLMDGAELVGAKLLIEASGISCGSLGSDSLDHAAREFATSFLASRDQARMVRAGDFAADLTGWEEAKILFERIEPEPRLVICGAGHVGASLASLAALVGYRVTLIDDRAEFLTRDRIPDEKIDLLVAVDWADSVCAAIGNGHGVSVAVVTRGHNEDEACMRAVMTTEADYVGLIGSKRRTNIVLDRLRQAGTDEQHLIKVHAPVGLDIGAVTPEEVALAILAEIIASRRGGTGASLSAWRRQS